MLYALSPETQGTACLLHLLTPERCSSAQKADLHGAGQDAPSFKALRERSLLCPAAEL